MTNLLIVLACAGLMAYALYSQEVLGLHPCPLCITQRIFVILVGVVALVALLHNPGTLFRRIYAGLGMLAAVIGAVVSGRHVYIQNLPPDQVPACGPGLEYMFSTFPFFEALAVLFQGDGNCAEVDWELLGLSMPAWVLAAFAGLFLVNLWQFVRRR
ncbi:disulfide bond formation protein B [Gilvimarinus sp. F26214L]|uniref:disulfide bond formation protein B n=1 Tax=Gilvimarinus sp. DZF01 TaxID=3461371 RepID=UPI00404619DF